MIQLSHNTKSLKGDIRISGSKSESNRWLILNALSNNILQIENLSNAKDTQVLQSALYSDDENDVIDIDHAGTAMRFLTAYFAIQSNKNVLLTGSDRMQNRPIAPLVTALQSLGADIQYVKKQGFPPLKINRKEITKQEVDIQANVSSQYITALMLIAPFLPNGLKINFIGKLTSRPYITMTQSQLERLGIQVKWLGNGIQIYPIQQYSVNKVFTESDWSSASYWYSIAALSENVDVRLGIFKEDSIQGDAVLPKIYEKYFGIKTTFQNNTIHLTKIKDFVLPDFFSLDLNHAPDIAQTILVTCAGLKIKTHLSGLHTLKVKETDRILAMQKELKKVGITTKITDSSIEIIGFSTHDSIPKIKTYQDHRMAMSFAALGLKHPIRIEDEIVVQKSYPNFWEDLQKVGFQLHPINNNN